MWSVTLFLCFVLLTLAWLWIKRRFCYWIDRGVPGPKPSFPLGNLFVRLRRPPDEIELEYLSTYGRLYGTFSCFDAKLNVSDRELVHRILVKDFHCFTDRDHFNTWHKVWNDNLFMLSGDRWRHVRSIVTPTFSCSKLRAMQSMMNKSVSKLCNHLDRLTNEKRGVEINSKEVFTNLTIDVIATTAFATQTHGFHLDRRNDAFLKNACGIFTFSFPTIISACLLPTWLNRLLGIEHIFPKNNFNFFLKLAQKIVEERRRDVTTRGNKRRDLMQLLLNATVTVNKSGHKPRGDDHYCPNDGAEETFSADSFRVDRLTNNEVIAQCIIFLIAGYETTANTLSFLIIELAHHQDIQDRLAADIKEAVKNIEIESDEYFERVVNGLPYLEATIKETLRRYPPVPRLQRLCTNPDGYELDGLHLAHGEGIEIAVYALHHDPDYYPQPLEFKPERFLPENKDQNLPYTFVPFGDGPRNCLGFRFAYQEMKLCLAQILLRYRFSPPEDDAHYPVRFEHCIGMLTPTGTSVNIERRCA